MADVDADLAARTARSLSMTSLVPPAAPAAPAPAAAPAVRKRRASSASVLDSDALIERIHDILSDGLAEGADVRAAAMEALALCGSLSHAEGVRTVADMLASDERFIASVVAPTESGKSYLVRAMVQHLLALNRVEGVFVFAGSVPAAREAYDGIAPIKVMPFSDETLGKFLEFQKTRMTPACIILDDILGTDADKSAAVRALVADGRHYNLSTFVVSQVANRALTPVIKQQSKFIIYGMLNTPNLTYVYDAITLRPSMTKAAFMKWSEEHVKGFNFGVWTRRTNRLSVVRA